MEKRIKINEYEVVIDLANGVFKALRHGQEWRDLIGDNFILSLLMRLEDATDLLQATLEDYEGEQYWAIERFLEENE